MKKKIINGILLVAMLFATTSAFVSCKDTDADYKSETDAKIAALQAQLDNLKGQVGPQGPQGPQGPAGQNGQDGQNGQNGQNGQDGLTPFIGDNGNWWIGTTDTGIAAKGQNGQDGKDGKDGQDGKNGKDGQDGLTPFIGSNGNWWIGDTDTKVPATGTGSQGPDFTEKIDALQNAIDELKSKIWGSEDEFNSAVKSIQEQIKELAQRIADVYTTEVTSLNVDKVVNPMFEFSTPFGVNSNVLITFFGEKAKRHIFFPKGAEEPIVWKGEYLIEGTGNAGKLYVTVNPSSVNFTGKTLKLVSTTGNESPVELTPLVASNKELKYITRGENDNAFYETYATIPVEKLAKAYFSWEPNDMQAFKDQIIDLLKSRGKEDIADMLQTLTNLIAGNDIPAYRLQASWGDGFYTYSSANIAAVALKPLTYAFDIVDEGQINDTPISELERLETYIVNRGTKNESTRSKIWRWLNKFNQETNRWLNNINWALQPTMFIESENEISRPGILLNYASYPAGEIKLIPSSWTVELFAPAYKKYVVVTKVDDIPVGPDDPVNANVTSEGQRLLGKVIPGSVNTIPFTLEAGKKYEIQYSALDYEGNIRTLTYFIKGGK